MDVISPDTPCFVVFGLVWRPFVAKVAQNRAYTGARGRAMAQRKGWHRAQAEVGAVVIQP
jgi:hypothetical protein